MKQYLDALEYVMERGTDHSDRTGVGTRSIFGYKMEFDLSEGFPAVTTKKLAWKSVVSELLWFLEGSTDERRLAEILYQKDREEIVGRNTIWTANADKQGKDLGYTNTESEKQLGPVYGKQWRDFGGIDQIAEIIRQIKEEPNSRRILLSAWNAPEISQMALPPCHILSHFKVDEGRLNCLMYQRSADMFLGVPFNIASYSLLTHMIADHCDLEVGKFVHMIGDAHIYNNHVDAVKKQLERTPDTLPKLSMPKIESFDVDFIKNMKLDDFTLLDYNPQETIKAEMAV